LLFFVFFKAAAAAWYRFDPKNPNSIFWSFTLTLTKKRAEYYFGVKMFKTNFQTINFDWIRIC
jgi:hypothetical protein